jgi:hypothetical protein
MSRGMVDVSLWTFLMRGEGKGRGKIPNLCYAKSGAPEKSKAKARATCRDWESWLLNLTQGISNCVTLTFACLDL